jgi:DNA-binding winged helix-turn-helix (wHTH) protein
MGKAWCQMLAPGSSLLHFGAFALDTARGVLMRDAIAVPLRRQSFEVLRYLAENTGRAVPSDELVRALWVSRPADPAASVGQCVKEVRRALGEDARWMVGTVSGRGYEFKGEIVQSESTRPALTEIRETGGNTRPPARELGAAPATVAFHARVFRRWAVVAGGVACASLAATYLPGQFASPRADHGAALVRPAEAARPWSAPPVSDSSVGGPVAEHFSPSDERRVAELAASKELPLPPLQMHAPGHEVPADVRRFVGIWASDAGWSGSNRQCMLIITDADRNGAVSGYQVNGPPQPVSRFQTLAHFSTVNGSVSAGSLSYEDAGGRYVASFLDQGRIQLDLTFRDGLVARVVLDPVWMLLNVDEAAGATPRTAAEAR